MQLGLVATEEQVDDTIEVQVRDRLVEPNVVEHVLEHEGQRYHRLGS